ncbi:MAG: hypothetical protein DMG57_08040 [Acidobacteria bacterium]|nr:MAG: hypothetical protein DMG57_08040 [Acidobacteriota bacterium]
MKKSRTFGKYQWIRVKRLSFWDRSTLGTSPFGDTGIYFIPSPERPSVEFVNFATRKAVTVATIPRTPAYGISIFTDGRWLLYSEYERHAS